MAGIEQQIDRRTGVGHEGVDIVLALYDASHVVVIDDTHAILDQPVAERGDASAELCPIVASEVRPAR